MIHVVDDDSQQDQFYSFVDNPPYWNPKTNGYHYDFKGRITQASVKNF